MAIESFSAYSPNVTLNSPFLGQTLLELTSLTYIPGTNELIVWHNGLALVLGVHYTEQDGTHVVLLFIPDNIGPDVDNFSLQTIIQGSSSYVPPPETFAQADPSRRPDNFGGTYVFDV